MSRAAHSLRLFRHPWLERLTMISAPAFIGLWALLLPLILWQAANSAGLNAALPWAAAGLLLWTLTEYGLHRFLFHWQPVTPALARLVWVLHGNHHDMPNDRLRNLMPPIVSLPVGAAIWALLLALIGPAGSWCFLGFIAGYVGYDLVHYGCHQWPMKGPIARRLKAHHMRHHHGRTPGNYAITGMIWDRALGTLVRTRQP